MHYHLIQFPNYIIIISDRKPTGPHEPIFFDGKGYKKIIASTNLEHGRAFIYLSATMDPGIKKILENRARIKAEFMPVTYEVKIIKNKNSVTVTEITNAK